MIQKRYRLSFVWIQDYRTFKNAQINFIPKYKIEYLNNNISIHVTEDVTEDFYGEDISLSVLVGGNGAGKTSLLRFVLNLCSGSRVGDDSVGSFIVVYEVKTSSGTSFEAYIKDVENVSGDKEINIRYLDTNKKGQATNGSYCILSNDINELPKDLEYIYYSDLISEGSMKSAFQWDRSNDISTGHCYKEMEERLYEKVRSSKREKYDDLFNSINELEDTLSQTGKNDDCAELIKIILQKLDSFDSLGFDRSVAHNYWKDEFKKQITFITDNANVLDDFDISISRATAYLIENNEWKRAFSDYSNKIEAFLPRTIIKNKTTFKKVLARVMFLNYLSDLVSHVVPDKYLESVRKEAIDIICMETTRKQGLNKLIWFFEIMKKRIEKLHGVSNLSVENYEELAKYAQQDSLYSTDAFHNYYIQGSFSFGIDDKHNCDIKDLRNWHKYYEKIISLTDFIEYSWGISSGELAVLTMFSRLNELKDIEANSVIIMLDEAETALHPKWQRMYINSVLKGTKELFREKTIQIMVATHSPIILSDIINTNAIYMQKKEGVTKIIPSETRKKTFAANIYTLYDDTFFLTKEGAIGKYAEEQLVNLLKEIEQKTNEKSKEINQKISYIGDELLKRKFEEKYQAERKQKYRLTELRKQKEEIEMEIKKIEGSQQ